jgi:hypothetical protein
MRRLWSVAVLLAFFGFVASAGAQQKHWNPASSSGDWNTTANIWGASSSGPFDQIWSNGSTANVLYSGGGTATLTLTEAISTGGIVWDGSVNINEGSGGSLTLADGAVIAGPSTAGGAELSINTQILGASNLSINGGNVYLNAANTFTELLVQGDAHVRIGRALTGTMGSLDSNVTLDGLGAVLSFESSGTFNRDVASAAAGNGTLIVAGSASSHTTMELHSTLSFTGTIQIAAHGTLALHNNGDTSNGYIGNASRIELHADGVIDATQFSNFGVDGGQTLTVRGDQTNGGRIVGDFTIRGKLVVGDADVSGQPVGVLRADGGTMAFDQGSTLQVNLRNWLFEDPGVNQGFVLGVNAAVLDFNSAVEGGVTIDVRGVDFEYFDAFRDLQWVIADFSDGHAVGGILGFDASKFGFDTTNFGYNILGGYFFMSLDANSNLLFLNYAAAPEPSVSMLIAAAGAGALWLRRKKKRSPA